MEFVQYEIQGHVGLLTINRPQALNALGSQVLEELDQAIDGVDLDQVRVLVVTGAGDKAFVAGADISEMKDMNAAEGQAYGEKGSKIFRKLETLPIPVIAAINGFALGGGNELAMSCDIRLCSDNAVFGQPEVGLGITPGFGGTIRLARLIGSVSKAKEILLGGRNIKADQALAIGLVSAVYPQADLMEAAMKMANTIAANAPIAVRKTKQAVNEGLDLPMDEALALEAKLFGECFDSEDQTEGMSAFLEKRKEKNFRNC